MLSEAGLQLIESRNFGFGPFTLLDRKLFSDSTGVSIHNFLQTLGDRNIPGLRSTGTQNLVLARKQPSLDCGPQ